MDKRLLSAMLDVDERHWWYRGRRRVILAELSRLALPPGARILDAGCGSGRTMVDLAAYGLVCGIELDPDAAATAAARDSFEVRTGRVEQLPWQEGSFDLIACLDVIEHVPDDRLALRELRRVCRPGGRLIVTVPAHPLLWSRHDEQNHHYRRYTRSTLHGAALAAGWELERLTSFMSLLLAPAAAVRLAQRQLAGVRRAGGHRARVRRADGHQAGVRRADGHQAGVRRVGDPGERGTDLDLGPPWLNGLLELPLRAEARWLAGGHRLPFGLSLLGVLRKPPAAAKGAAPRL
jgi:2-polyprenyl-3-methyl-5-hydroxy-6-metoxy-1,4-benzoquinol methylase